MVRVIFFEGNPQWGKQTMSYENAAELAAVNELDLICINDNENIYKIVDIQKENYRCKIKEKNDKRNSKLIVKDFTFNINIHKLDLERKLTQIRQYNNKNYRIKIVVFSKNRNTTKQEFDDFLNNIVTFTKMKITNINIGNKNTTFELV